MSRNEVGLVEQQHRRRLGEHHGQPDPLSLPAGEAVDRHRREVHQVGALQGRGDGLLVGAAPGAEQPVVGVAAALDELENADPLGHDRLLGQQAEAAGHLAGAQGADLVAVEEHRTATGAQ